MAGGATFSCESCGKQYPWKPELAGKRAKCKCGAVLNIPAQPEAVPMAVAAAPVEESTGYRCPSCQADLTPGAAICVNCGFDLRTGQTVGTQIDTGGDDAEAVPTPKKKKKKAAGAAAPAASSGKVSATGWVGVTKSKREKAAEHEQDKSRTIKTVVIAMALLVAVVGVVLGGKYAFNKMGKKGPDVKLPANDAEAIDLLQNHDGMEAKKFLEDHKSRMIGLQWTQAKALAKIQQWYEMGAVKVSVPSDGLMARQVIIELPPEDKEKRMALIQLGGRFEDEEGQKVLKDVGQKYVIVYP